MREQVRLHNQRISDRGRSYALGKLIERMLPDNVDAKRIVEKATEMDPKKRYTSAAQMKSQIQKIREKPAFLDQKFEKIVFIRNNIEVKDTRPIGFLPGDYNEKMLQYAMPLADHLGGVESLDMLVKRGAIEVVHLGLIRGREFRDSIIICDESQNMTTEQIQLVIGRVGDNSRLWINGDIKQCDMEVFRRNSGLQRAIDRLKGNPLFGYVHLVKTERSKTAALADLLD